VIDWDEQEHRVPVFGLSSRKNKPAARWFFEENMHLKRPIAVECAHFSILLGAQRSAFLSLGRENMVARPHTHFVHRPQDGAPGRLVRAVEMKTLQNRLFVPFLERSIQREEKIGPRRLSGCLTAKRMENYGPDKAQPPGGSGKSHGAGEVAQVCLEA